MPKLVTANISDVMMRRSGRRWTWRSVVVSIVILVLMAPGGMVWGMPLKDISPREGEGEASTPSEEALKQAKSETGSFLRTNSLGELDPVKQLKKYGYLRDEDANLPGGKQDVRSISNAIKLYQSFYGLNQTGQLDDETVALMNTPRCGRPDIQASHTRKKRYVIVGKSHKTRMTWALTQPSQSQRMGAGQVKGIIQRALGKWSAVSSLQFTQRPSGPADIEIGFYKRHHGDSDPFDGPGGVLAHAYFPHAGSDMHLDDEETWTSDTASGVNLLQIITHEAGHSLGLGHSTDRQALMYAYYRGYDANFRLAQDDINGIRELYGNRFVPRPTPQPTPYPTWYPITPYPTRRPNPNPNPNPYPTPNPNPNPYPTPNPNPNPYPTPNPNPYPRPYPTPYPNPYPTPVPPRPTPVPPRPTYIVPDGRRHFCDNGGRFDGIVSFLKQRKTYAFEGDKYYSLNDNGVDAGYPRYIYQDFTRELVSIDTAIVLEENGNEYLYVIQNGQVWKFSYNPLTGRPIKVWSAPMYVRDVFRNLPPDVDAGFFFKKYNAIYFFRGSQYYRLHRDPSNRYEYTYIVDTGYPLDKRIWSIPSTSVACVFTWEGNDKVYFFSGSQYYRYDENNLRVDTSTPIPYPRDVRQWWLGCPRSASYRAEAEMDPNNMTDPYLYNHEKRGSDVSQPPNNTLITGDETRKTSDNTTRTDTSLGEDGDTAAGDGTLAGGDLPKEDVDIVHDTQKSDQTGQAANHIPSAFGIAFFSLIAMTYCSS